MLTSQLPGNLKRHRRNLLQYLPEHFGTDYEYSVYARWQVSVDIVESGQGTVSSHAIRLLSLIGFYYYDQIPVQMFYNAWHGSQWRQVSDYLPWHDAISNFIEYRQSVQASITLLASCSLITRNTQSSLSLHPLVHDWCRDRIPEDERQLRYQQALWLLTASVEWEFKTENYTFRRTLVSHVHEFLRLRDQHGEIDDENKIQNWPTLALILEENGCTRNALQLTEEVLTLRKSLLGDDHSDTLTSMNGLAIQYSKAGRLTEALQLMEEVLTLRKSILGKEHPDTLTSMNGLAIQYSKAGRLTEALQLMEEVLTLRKSMRKSLLGKEHPDTLTSMNGLAIQYSKAGRLVEALQLTEEVLTLRKSILGKEHPDTLTSMNGLAIQYSKAGRLVEEVLLERASS